MRAFFIRLMIAIAFLCVMAAAPEGAYAKKKRRKGKGGKKPRIVDIDFDDELQIKGRLQGPMIFSLFNKKDLNYGRLIKPKKDFLPEMRRTFEDIK